MGKSILGAAPLYYRCPGVVSTDPWHNCASCGALLREGTDKFHSCAFRDQPPRLFGAGEAERLVALRTRDRSYYSVSLQSLGFNGRRRSALRHYECWSGAEEAEIAAEAIRLASEELLWLPAFRGGRRIGVPEWSVIRGGLWPGSRAFDAEELVAESASLGGGKRRKRFGTLEGHPVDKAVAKADRATGSNSRWQRLDAEGVAAADWLATEIGANVEWGCPPMYWPRHAGRRARGAGLGWGRAGELERLVLGRLSVEFELDEVRATLRPGRLKARQQEAHDAIAVVVAEIVEPPISVNRRALARYLDCSEATISRLAKRGRMLNAKESSYKRGKEWDLSVSPLPTDQQLGDDARRLRMIQYRLDSLSASIGDIAGRLEQRYPGDEAITGAVERLIADLNRVADSQHGQTRKAA